MAEKSTIARPYAQAIFDLAQQQGKLSEWSDILKLSATIVTDDGMQQLIGNPRMDQAQLAQLIFDISGDVGANHLSQDAQNMIKLLIENGRLSLLPEICALYEVYRAEAEKIVQAEIISARPVTDAQQQSIAVALKKRLGREVSLTSSVDENLVGGAIIRAGDMVIDGSITGHLARFTSQLS